MIRRPPRSTLFPHDALPILLQDERIYRSRPGGRGGGEDAQGPSACGTRSQPVGGARALRGDRKSTRLNSSHSQISYAVFCLKKKKQKLKTRYTTQTQLFVSD